MQLTVYENEKKLYSDFGEMLFTHFGLSGPLVLSARDVYKRQALRWSRALCITH